MKPGTAAALPAPMPMDVRAALLILTWLRTPSHPNFPDNYLGATEVPLGTGISPSQTAGSVEEGKNALRLGVASPTLPGHKNCIEAWCSGCGTKEE